ncbi:MAG: S-layer domain protein [Microgenomates group bacterium GW2011_GWA1_46_15]|nr:MAG: S-layer domain protein [Microgenomates group bacterium GW2011_GWB1_45_17]KKU23616.1 MAG: S-layer domain protein [Microgenomates group bacterium GW2011_GWC1_46_15]KKU24335.1 MAG: S-layer domain protein [Microgenomates group bacterium GW2011_GWA1_46_15]
MMWQTLVFFLLSVALLSVFFFLLLPSIARLYTAFSPKSSITTTNDAFPPQVPIVVPLPEATNSAKLVVGGIGEANTSMVLQNNGSVVQEVRASADGSFAFEPIFLTDGNNDILVVSRNDQKAESRSQTQTVLLKTTKPQLSVTAPQDGAVFTRTKDQTVSVQGKTDPNVQTLLNGKLLITTSDGSFVGTYLLGQGENTLKIQAIDQAGNMTEQEVKVTYQP